MPLTDKIQKDIRNALKAQDTVRLSALRMIKAALDIVAKDPRNIDKTIDEAMEQQVLQTMVKRHKEAIDLFLKGNRPELAARESAEIEVIEGYMPKMATEQELDEAVELAFRDTGIKPSMGSVMVLAKSYLAGKRVDGKTLSQKVKERLQ